MDSKVSNAELQIPGYQITRLDRQTGEHGGILLYTNDGIDDVQIREDPALAEYAEALWCDISSPGSEFDILLGIVYRSDNNTKEMNDSLNHVLRSLGERKEVMVIGDFNYREINWETMQAGSKKAEDFLDVVMDNLWTQHVTKPTRLNSLLDLVLTSNPNMVDEADVIAHLGTSDHNTIQWELNCQIELEQQTPKRDFKNANFDKMKEVLKQVNWKEELRECTTDEAWKRTKEKLQHQIRTHVS